MEIMKVAIGAILALLLVLILSWAYVTQGARSSLKKEMNAAEARLWALKLEQTDLQSEIEYYSHPENLEKLLLEKLNLKRPGEQSIIFSQ